MSDEAQLRQYAAQCLAAAINAADDRSRAMWLDMARGAEERAKANGRIPVQIIKN